jgi:hypothetical protein
MGSLLGSDSLEDEGLVAGDVVVLAVWVLLVDIIEGRRFAIGSVRREVIIEGESPLSMHDEFDDSLRGLIKVVVVGNYR